MEAERNEPRKEPRKEPKRYKTSAKLVFGVRDELERLGHKVEITMDGSTPYVLTDASASAFHDCVLRALCSKAEDETGFPFVTKTETKNQVLVRNLAGETGRKTFAVANPSVSGRGEYESPNAEFKEKIFESVKEKTSPLELDDEILRAGIPKERLIEEAKELPISERCPELATSFTIDSEKIRKLVSATLLGESDSLAKWVLNSSPGDEALVVRNAKAPIGIACANGTHMQTKDFPLTGIAVLLEKDDDSFLIKSAYPCVAGNDDEAILNDVREWRRYYVRGKGKKK